MPFPDRRNAARDDRPALIAGVSLILFLVLGCLVGVLRVPNVPISFERKVAVEPFPYPLAMVDAESLRKVGIDRADIDPDDNAAFLYLDAMQALTPFPPAPAGFVYRDRASTAEGRWRATKSHVDWFTARRCNLCLMDRIHVASF